MKPDLYVVPGILTKKNKPTAFHNFVGAIAERLGYEANKCWYGWFTALLVRFRNVFAVKKLNKMIPDGANVICHSNGGALVWKLYSKYNKKFNRIILVQPALDTDKTIPKSHCESVTLLKNKDDKTVKLAKIYRFFYWGSQGRDSVKEPVPNHYKIIDTIEEADLHGHSWYVEYEGVKLLEKILTELKHEIEVQE